MRSNYTEEDGDFDGDLDVIATSDETPFHVGQSYASKPVAKLTCKQCGGDQFQVGSEEYFTAIRCPTCKWETGIHEG